MPRLNVEFKKNVYDQLAVLASESGCTISQVVRELVLEWIAERWREKASVAPVGGKAKKEEVQDVG
jgi:hypothetical protein